MKTVRITLDLDTADGVTVEAEVNGEHATVTRTTGGDGQPVETTPDDLDRIERHLFPVGDIAIVDALDLGTGNTESFLVTHEQGRVVTVRREHGGVVAHNSPQFTEVAEAWHIDREYAEAVESDQPHAAALAGYIHPQEWPNSSGHGLRRAA